MRLLPQARPQEKRRYVVTRNGDEIEPSAHRHQLKHEILRSALNKNCVTGYKYQMDGHGSSIFFPLLILG